MVEVVAKVEVNLGEHMKLVRVVVEVEELLPMVKLKQTPLVTPQQTLVAMVVPLPSKVKTKEIV
jgi:acyl CoA:acetate/3-ketoacid CoA transferase alpha subunit